MLETLETLIALSNYGTMSKAAVVLRVTQSAVSKRIANLEAQWGVSLIERDGRRVRITENGQQLINKVSPLLREMHEVLEGELSSSPPYIRFGMAESILSSWGASKLKEISDVSPVRLEIFTHRSPMIVEKLLAGEIDIGLCAGQIPSIPGQFISEKIFDEEMVIITASTRDKTRPAPHKVITIETHSSTWKSIRAAFVEKGLECPMRLQSFFSIAQLALVGLGDGLVPIKVAETLKIPRQRIFRWRGRPMTRPIQVIYKKHKMDLDIYKKLISHLKKGKP